MIEEKPVTIAEQMAIVNITAAVGKLNYYMQMSALYVITNGDRNPTGLETDDEKDKVVEFSKNVKFSFKKGGPEWGLVDAIANGSFEFTPDEVYGIIGRYLGWRFGIKEKPDTPDSEEAPKARAESDWKELAQNMIDVLENSSKQRQDRAEALKKSVIYTPEAERGGKSLLDARERAI